MFLTSIKTLRDKILKEEILFSIYFVSEYHYINVKDRMQLFL